MTNANKQQVELYGVKEWALLKPRSAEWKAAWKAMAQRMNDPDCEALDPDSGEVWQYMGSLRRARLWEHEFRHRWHPRIQQRIVFSVPATRGWKPAAAERL